MNRLAHERSPYLLQHADNPVEWFPWGDEAFGKSRAEDKPIFLSVGYSTCHWCHVMEHESFENTEVARLLNDHFVSVKVDREERPDVDRVYMAFVQATTGSGGWPMSVWLTPDLKPFYGGTYFPPVSRWGRPGFADILREIARAWETDRDRVGRSADEVTDRLRTALRSSASPSLPGPGALAWTLMQFKQSYDGRHGGFGDAPKFPRPSELLFLLREHARTGDAEALGMVQRTLKAMAGGGVRDHIGGGFHRYSVDAAWRVPHFEKMLYDQAQLVLAYLEAGQASGDVAHIEVAEDTLRYVMREMTDEGGGFYSAEDADSVPPERASEPEAGKTEGAFYLWRAEEIDALAGNEAAVVKLRYGMAPDGNAPADPQEEFAGKNLLYIARSIDELSAETGMPPADLVDLLSRARLRMFRARLGRPRPHLDDKVLASWNGLMIAAFARAARVIRGRSGGGRTTTEPYVNAARRAASFLRDRMWDGKRQILLRRFRDGRAEIDGYAEDYACVIFGLLELLQADPDPRWLEWALTLQRRQDELFWDEVEGGWFSTSGGDSTVLFRMKEEYDGAEPAASSVSVFNLMTLSHLVDAPEWTEKVDRTLRLFGTRLEQMGRAVPMMAAALSTYLGGPQQVILLGADAGAGELERIVALRYRPFAFTLSLTPAEQRDLSAVLPLVAAMSPGDGGAAYICRNFTCQPPVTSAAALERALG
jgi:uncharacterized protein YyaL (SSP411 family)